MKNLRLFFSPPLALRYLCNLTPALMKFPIGIQTFPDIIDNGFVYVAKTRLVP